MSSNTLKDIEKLVTGAITCCESDRDLRSKKLLGLGELRLRMGRFAVSRGLER